MDSEIKSALRVLHVLHSMNRGGAENAIMNYYRFMDRDKVQFDFLLTDSNKSDFEDEILSLGGRIYRVPALTISNPFKYINSINRFFKSHPEYKIIHSHTSSKSVIPLAIAKHNNIPVRISHSHSSKSEQGIKGIIRNALIPFLKSTANIYFSCGEQAAEWLYGREFQQRGKVQIIRNVINADKFIYNPEVRTDIRKKLGINDSTLVIGQTARFCKEKNHRFSIDIIREIKAVIPDARLLLLGDGPQRDDINEYAQNNGVSENVIMAGVIPNVYDYEQAMDAFILPSFYEGLPLSIIEAQVSGLPCFTTKGAVSEECSVTNLVKYLPLEAGASFWANEIIKIRDLKRTDRFEQIKAAGYDACSAAKTLQNIYIGLAASLK